MPPLRPLRTSQVHMVETYEQAHFCPHRGKRRPSLMSQVLAVEPLAGPVSPSAVAAAGADVPGPASGPVDPLLNMTQVLAGHVVRLHTPVPGPGGCSAPPTGEPGARGSNVAVGRSSVTVPQGHWGPVSAQGRLPTGKPRAGLGRVPTMVHNPCSLCDYCGKTPWYVSRHEMMHHTGVKAYGCSGCPTRFFAEAADADKHVAGNCPARGSTHVVVLTEPAAEEHRAAMAALTTLHRRRQDDSEEAPAGDGGVWVRVPMATRVGPAPPQVDGSSDHASASASGSIHASDHDHSASASDAGHWRELEGSYAEEDLDDSSCYYPGLLVEATDGTQYRVTTELEAGVGDSESELATGSHGGSESGEVDAAASGLRLPLAVTQSRRPGPGRDGALGVSQLLGADPSVGARGAKQLEHVRSVLDRWHSSRPLAGPVASGGGTASAVQGAGSPHLATGSEAQPQATVTVTTAGSRGSGGQSRTAGPRPRKAPAPAFKFLFE
jgi:hypothetical protein